MAGKIQENYVVPATKVLELKAAQVMCQSKAAAASMNVSYGEENW